MEAVAEYIPEIYAFVYANYHDISQLQFGEYIIESAEGPQQGDVLSALLFCIAIHPLLKQLRSNLCVGYMDDVSLGGPLRLAERDVGLIMAEAKTYGLKCNVAKCELISRRTVTLDDNSNLKEFKKISIENMTLLGAPIVGPAALNVVLEDKVVQLDNAIKRLKYLHFTMR